MRAIVRSNVDRMVRFDLEGVRMARRLVRRPVEDMATELNVNSPVGRALLMASTGEQITVSTPGGEIVVQLLEVGD